MGTPLHPSRPSEILGKAREAAQDLERVDKLPTYRQSLIATFDSCPLRAKFAMEDTRRTPSPVAARGTLIHRFVHKAIKKMHATGERSYPVEMGMELLTEILCQRDVPSEEVVPITMEEMKWARVIAVKWCESVDIDATRMLAAEERFFADLALPIGETVQVTGQLDLLLADPPDGLWVIDYKSGYRRPAEPRNMEKAEREGSGLTALGWAQWLIYSYLMFENFPSINRVAFGEHHLLRGEKRYARMERWEMERLKDVLAAQVSLLHQATQEGPDSPRWTPTAGPHCFGGETRFLTDRGVRTLRDACGERVRILNRYGEWEDGEVRAFGRQQLLRMTFDDGSVVRATPDHRWWPAKTHHRSKTRECIDCGGPTGETRCRACSLRYQKTDAGRSEISEAMRNAGRDSRITTVEVDAVPIVRWAHAPNLDLEGIRHGIVFGDGNLRKNRGWSRILLQPHKAELARFFSNDPIPRFNRGTQEYAYFRPIKTARKDCHGTTGCVEITLQPAHYKQLPDPASCTPEYARGFIAGLIATDGTAGMKGTVAISCEGIERGERIAELARLGGCVTRRSSLGTKPSNFSPVGTITRELVGIKILPSSAPLIRSDHVANFEVGQKKQWRMMYRHVVDLVPTGEDDVFCLVVPGSESFTLANGVATSNCAMCAAPRRCPIMNDEDLDPETPEGRQRVAQEWIVAGEVRKRRRDILDGLVDVYGPIPVLHSEGRRVVGWDVHPDGKRNFAMFEPRDLPESQYDEKLAAATREAGVLVDD
jgi:hypothetical protein